MAYVINNPRIGMQKIATTDTVQNLPLGTVVTATDPTYGTGEFVYLVGVGSTAVGSPVTYNVTTYQTALAPDGANIPQPVAIAMSANPAASYGWYQISGVAVAVKSAVSLSLNGTCGITTAGTLAASATGAELQGVVVAAVATASATTVQVMISRPHMQGRIT